MEVKRKKGRLGFATRVGAVAAAVGSAVGLGNIWRFPYEAGQNGGGAFIIVYVLCVIALGIPVMLSEFVIGRSTHKNMMGALKQLSPGSKVYAFSYVAVLGAIVTLGFYCVVCGWVIDYLFQALLGNMQGHTPQEYTEIFNGFVGNGWMCLLWTFVFLVVNFWVMSHGVQKGIERVSSIMMPGLFVLLLVFCVNSLLLPGSWKGVEFLLSPDFSKLTWKGVVDAMGQAFMSLTLGISGMVTYSSYFKDDSPLAKDAVTIATLDSLVAILAGVVIFPAVFSFGMQPEAGPKLVFEILPSIFQQMTGGYIWAVLFFVLLLFASLTSTISLSEIPIAFISEEFKVSRMKAINILAVLTLLFAVPSALSFNVLGDITVGGMNIFDLLNYASSNFFMLLGGLFTAVYVGWMLDKRVIADQLSNRNHLNKAVFNYTVLSLRYVAPVCVLIIFLYYVGLI
ncbi:MAG: sodium-dependent transporter [Muribaculaceae bacterium]|nr:sodium-dependent transporter [Muribaculaceae bacterium]